jgi:hypothetical protein
MKLQTRIKEYDLNKYLNDYAFFNEDCVYLSSFQNKNELEEQDSKILQHILKVVGYKTIAKNNGLIIIQFNVNRMVDTYFKIKGCYED